MSLNFPQAKVFEYLRNPFVCAAIIATITYYIYSNNYLTKSNVRDRFPVKCQRIANIKSALYIFLIAVIMLFIFRYSCIDCEEQHGGMLHGHPPF